MKLQANQVPQLMWMSRTPVARQTTAHHFPIDGTIGRSLSHHFGRSVAAEDESKK